MKTKRMLLIALFAIVGQGFVLQAHEGHESPKSLPPVGPHGGKYTKLKNHFAEVTVQGSTASIYILEHDLKGSIQETVTVDVQLEVPGKGKKPLVLVKSKDGYRSSINIPKGTRRVYFHVTVSIDGSKESGKILYEPK